MNIGAYAGRAVLTAIDIVNTGETDSGHDDLHDADRVAELLGHRGWVVPTPPSQADLTRLLSYRDTLRQAFDSTTEHEAVHLLNHTLAALRALPQLTEHDGHWHWHYAPPDAGIADRVAATTSAALLSLIASGGHDRMRRCSAENCSNVFVDFSRNGSRRYCSSTACGNRTHAAAYRARQRATDT
ncbi:CGNR zinc finger domain-containing protein [Umezawaea endophytica]|uniref:CGNR zinc finger domain-containing protein n=1 Tax=Umezawaea endophytica TaxID=1654476 RepID=A0A9X3A447_9PSEU|nr:CGNR zinc finger domain-containing protein [Umezawaea endophytica]MCS7482474.1 CGNR zinc finger domain-containing protein [Umezawaea endophytica]